MAAGWSLTNFPNLGHGVAHSSGFYVTGFSSSIEAQLWLQDYLLRHVQHEIRERMRDERRRLRLLARMQPQGLVS